MSDSTIQRITFFTKKPTVCAVCNTKFYREDLLSGGGRLIAGNLTEEMRRLYEPSKKFGELYPLTYPVMVCPSCLFAAYPQDFVVIGGEAVQNLKDDGDRRAKTVSLIFKDLDFTKFRDLKEGVASYYLAMMCYDFVEREFFPTFKRGLSALRAAWLLDDLHRKYSDENYDYLAKLFYRKARFFYLLAVEYSQNGEEPLGASINYGPDLDKNYGYDGFLYIAGLLEFRYGPKRNVDNRIKALEGSKRIVSKLFGTGKVTKSKPSAILDNARDLYDKINREIKVLKGEG